MKIFPSFLIKYSHANGHLPPGKRSVAGVAGRKLAEQFIVHLASILSRVYVELGLYQCSLLNRVVPSLKNYTASTPRLGHLWKRRGKSEFFMVRPTPFRKHWNLVAS